MATDEAYVNARDSDIRYVTVADANALTKGTIMVVGSSPNTAVAHSAVDELPLGILVEDKVALDGQTQVGIRVRGDVEIIAEASTVLGNMVVLAATANNVKEAGGTVSTLQLSRIVGRALDTGSAGTFHTIRLMLG